VVSLAITQEGELLAPISVDSRGFFGQDERHDVLDEINAASEKILNEFAKKRDVDAQALAKSIKIRISDILRRLNGSYAVVMPLISVAGSERDSVNWLEKEFFR